MAVVKDDPAFAEAIVHAQDSLPEFRQILAEPKHSRAAGAIRMVKVFVSEGTQSMWLWLNVESDDGHGFAASVFEAPPEFPSLKAGTIKSVPDSEVADWAVIDDDGLVNGGFSLRLARCRLPENERASYDSYIGAKVYAPLPSNRPPQPTRETRTPER
jgi:uncharacterized protein YegJ (DUF2314 family)